MVTDEQLVERLRMLMEAATADVAPRRELVEELAAHRVRRSAWQVVSRRAHLDGAAIFFATATAIAIAVLAVVLLGHARTPQSDTAALQPPQPAATLPALRTELAILRRPQRSEDRIPAWGVADEQRPLCSNCLNVPNLLPRESRLLTTLGSGSHRERERIYLVLGTVPSRWQNTMMSGWRQGGVAARGLHLSLVGLTHPQPHIAGPANVLLNYSQLPISAQSLNPRDVLITDSATVGVVPDGVARVRWELANPGQARAVTVYPRVRANVAIAPWTPAPRSTGLINEQLLVGATWYDTDGHIIARFHDSIARITKVYSAPQSGQTQHR